MLKEVSRNLIANFIGRFWGVFSGLFLAPIYLNILGTDNYATIVVILMVNAYFSISDFGYSSYVVNLVAQKRESSIIVDFRRTEKQYIIILALAFTLLIVGSFAKPHIIGLGGFVQNYGGLLLILALMELPLKLLGQFYSNALLGLNEHVVQNRFRVTWGIFRNGVVVLVLLLQNSILAFFSWQLLVTLCYVVFLKIKLFHLLEQSAVSESKDVSKEHKQGANSPFILGLWIVNLIAVLSVQFDKYLTVTNLSKLEITGYSLVFTLSNVFMIIAVPIKSTLLPLTIRSREGGVKGQYGFGTSLYVGLATPFLMLFYFWGDVMVRAWLGNDNDLNSIVLQLLPFIATGVYFSALQVFSYNEVVASRKMLLNNAFGVFQLAVIFIFYPSILRERGLTDLARFVCGLNVVISLLYITTVYFKFKLSDGQLLVKYFILVSMVAIVIAGMLRNYCELNSLIVAVIYTVLCISLNILFYNVVFGNGKK